jgi:hypothetical protein
MLRPTDLERRDLIKAVFGDALIDDANGPRFKAYLERYCSLVCPDAPADAAVDLDTPAIATHADVLSCITIIVYDPSITFNDFVAKAVERRCPEASPGEKEYVARVAVETAFLVNCVPRDLFMAGVYHHSDRYRHGALRHQRARWEGDIPFLSFMENAFSAWGTMVPEDDALERRAETIRQKSSLKAWKLTKRCGIKIRATDNLLEHLALDPKSMTLKVFHHVSFLRGHLTKTREQPLDLSFEESLKR